MSISANFFLVFRRKKICLQFHEFRAISKMSNSTTFIIYKSLFVVQIHNILCFLFITDLRICSKVSEKRKKNWSTNILVTNVFKPKIFLFSI